MGLGCIAAGPDGDAAKERTAVHTGYRDLLADSNIDVVVITSPNHTHASVLADALATDKHVLIEKPLCTTVDDCKQVVDAAAERDAITWMGLQYRFADARHDVGTAGDRCVREDAHDVDPRTPQPVPEEGGRLDFCIALVASARLPIPAAATDGGAGAQSAGSTYFATRSHSARCG